MDSILVSEAEILKRSFGIQLLLLRSLPFQDIATKLDRIPRNCPGLHDGRR